MFKPRHAYRSPIVNRYRGKAKGCPVFNNISDVSSTMVEQHDECLECLAKIKNRNDLYRTLAENNKPSNNVIKSLQRLSSSASNNRLKTCLQFLIIKVNEKSITPNQQQPTNQTSITPTTTISAIGAASDSGSSSSGSSTTGSCSASGSPKSLHDTKETLRQCKHTIIHNEQSFATTKHNAIKKQKLQHKRTQQNLKANKHDQLPSPPQDQVSSTQDQDILDTQLNNDTHECQTSPVEVATTHYDEKPIEDHDHSTDDEKLHTDSPATMLPSLDVKIEAQKSMAQFTNSSLDENSATAASTITTSTATTTTTTTTSTATATTSTSPLRNDEIELESATKTHSDDSAAKRPIIDGLVVDSNNQAKHIKTEQDHSSSSFSCKRKRKSAHVNRQQRSDRSSDHDSLSAHSESPSSYTLSSPISNLSTSTTMEPDSDSDSDSSCSSRCSTYSSCSSAMSSRSPSPVSYPLSSPDVLEELRGPRLKLSEEKIRKIKKRPIMFDDCFAEQSFASTPTTSSGCSPGQHSNTTQNSDQCNGRNFGAFGMNNNFVIHTFQAPPKFVNNLRPCNLPAPKNEPPRTPTPQAPVKEMLNCAICGIKDRPPSISKFYGQNSCVLCTKFFATFIKYPQQLYCAQDGDCLMTFDSRCQACWIKICLQKFDIEEDQRKIGQKFSPKLLSSPNVSLITIDTTLSR